MISPLQGSAIHCQTSVIMVMVVVVMVGGQQDTLAGARQRHDGAAVGRGERVAREGLYRRAERDLATVEAEHEIPRARLLDVVRGDQDAVALVSEGLKQLLEAISADSVEPGERLVEQEQLGVLDQSARDQDTLALPTGEVAERTLSKVGEPNGVERLESIRALRTPRPPVPRNPSDGPHRRDVKCRHGKVKPRPFGLRDKSSTNTNVDFAANRGELAEQGTEERRLAAAVRTKDPNPLAGPNRKIDIAQNRRPAVANRKPMR
jgi:hypothetical protein